MEYLDIKSAIKRHGHTVNEIADKLGINRVTLSRQITGNPSVDTLQRIAAAIGCSVTDLFDNDSQTASEQQVDAAITCPECGTKIKLNPTV